MSKCQPHLASDNSKVLLQALRRFENMSSIEISGAAKIADLAMLAVELEQDAGAWRVRSAVSCVNTWHVLRLQQTAGLVSCICVAIGTCSRAADLGHLRSAVSCVNTLYVLTMAEVVAVC